MVLREAVREGERVVGKVDVLAVGRQDAAEQRDASEVAFGELHAG